MQQFVERKIGWAADPPVAGAQGSKGNSDESQEKAGRGGETLHGEFYVLGLIRRDGTAWLVVHYQNVVPPAGMFKR